MMDSLGNFCMDLWLVLEDLKVYTWQPHYFWLGEVRMAAVQIITFAKKKNRKNVVQTLITVQAELNI